MRAKNADEVPVFATPTEIKAFWTENKALFSAPGAVKLRTITIPKLVDGDVSTALRQKALVEEIHVKAPGRIRLRRNGPGLLGGQWSPG